IPKLKTSGAEVNHYLDVCGLQRSEILRLASRALLLSRREQLGECFVDQLSQQGRLGWFEVSELGIGHKSRWKIVAGYEMQCRPRACHHLPTHGVGQHGLQHSQPYITQSHGERRRLHSLTVADESWIRRYQRLHPLAG